MPRRPGSPCIADPMCPNLKPCPDHPVERGPSAARGKGSTAQKPASLALRRRYPDGPCGRCGQLGAWDDPHDPLTAGHIVHDGPTTLENLQPEHRSCGNRERNVRRGRDEHGRFR